MPLTLAHPAAVLPLRRLGLPLTALVTGSMVPDLPLFVSWPDGRRLTHSVGGALTLDLAVGVVVLVAWFGLVRDALVDLAPRAVRSRLAPHVRLSRRELLLAPPGIALGALTHLAWDSFTHLEGRGAAAIGWLQDVHGGQPGYWWAQWFSAVVGLAAVGLACLGYLRRLPVRGDRPPPPCSPHVLTVAVAAAALVGVANLVAHLAEGFQLAVQEGVIAALAALAVGLAAASLVWWYAGRRRAARLTRRARAGASPPGR